MTHPYFVYRARTYIAHAGGDPAVAGPLAAWAEAHAPSAYPDPVPGVLVGEDGTLHAEIRKGSLARNPHKRGAWRVTDLHTDIARDVIGREQLQFAIAKLRRTLADQGLPSGVIEASYSDVCMGRCVCGEQHRRPYPDTDPRSRRATPSPASRARFEEAPY